MSSPALLFSCLFLSFAFTSYIWLMFSKIFMTLTSHVHATLWLDLETYHLLQRFGIHTHTPFIHTNVSTFVYICTYDFILDFI
ncbi:hypothetical protein C8J55DRAFT_320347 [Lentinula edodes]|uniref:Uncharacterized protein n=1 Tax=Lentinula lateritia TaxID=40482 RepID=A0A9W9ARK6_9AGAR|nr:hypothetical protein C8J55DRAFT_320347 [Lentinula edodes]